MERKRDYMTVQELTENEKYKFWYFKIKECKESGLSVKDFCDKNNIKPSTYYNYQQKIRNILCDQINENNYKNEVSFVSVEKQPHNNEKIIIIKGSIKIELDSDTPYHLVNHELGHAFFSDTFLVWLYISPLSKPLLGGFLKKCSIIFCEALKRGIPLRGTISMGSAIMDEENRIFLGKPLVEAAKAVLRQKWLGVAIGKSVVDTIGQFNPKDMEYLLPYRNHMKYECDPFLSDFVLNWFSYWNKFENNDIEKIIEDMNTDISFDDYYKNTLLYVKHAKKHCIIWNEHLICADIAQLKRLYKMRTNLDEERKCFMCEGIKLLTSNKILKNIEYIIKKNEGVWFDPNDKDILLMYNNGFIEVDDTKISLDYLKKLYG